MAISGVVDQAARLDDIHFPEFTAKLITDTFDALIAANLHQTESYITLVQAISKTLTTYVNDTKDDITGAEILQFLATLLPSVAGDTNPVAHVAKGNQLLAADVTTLDAALTVPGDAPPSGIPSGAALQQSDMDLITGLVSRRLAANKYTFLKEMVKMGIVRLVVTQGVIKTTLMFSAWASNYYGSNSSTYNTANFDVHARINSGKRLAKWFSASANANYSSVGVRTTNTWQQDNSGSSVNIFGGVEINFKTDYQTLGGP